eukprot:965776-Pyramimonas_sp.AAC.1
MKNVSAEIGRGSAGSTQYGTKFGPRSSPLVIKRHRGAHKHGTGDECTRPLLSTGVKWPEKWRNLTFGDSEGERGEAGGRREYTR